MKKEVFIAILIGLVLGLIVTYGVYIARNSFLDNSTKVLPTPSPSSSPSPEPSSLTLVSPDDESIQFIKDTQITGTSTTASLIVIFVNDRYFITRTDQSGNFSVQTTLDPGANVIVVRSIDEQGKTVEVRRTVIYSLTALDNTATASSSATAAVATPSAKVKKTTQPVPSPTTTSTGQ